MTLRNRVTPLGEIVAAPGRGAWMGNRGVLHGRSGEVTRRWAGRAWITCALSFKGQRLPLADPGRNTQLFFLDEAVALAAGHRPCAYCRRPAFDAYCDALGEKTLARDLDVRLHAERLAPRTTRPWRALPIGAYVVTDRPHLVLADALLPWLPDNTYGAPVTRPDRGRVEVLTPATSLAALAGEYPAQADNRPRS